MLSFLGLPPEIRLAIHNSLLQHMLAKVTRTLYTGDNSLLYKGSPRPTRHKQSYHIEQDQITFDGNKSIKMLDIFYARYNIHLAEIDDLLYLASTCRLIMSEVLAIAWSNADISVSSPKLSMDLHCIFYDRLSSNTCSFIRTLQIQASYGKWSAQEMRKTAALIRRRLPQLEQLIVNIPLKIPDLHEAEDERKVALAELQNLPMQITVKFIHYVAAGYYNAFMKSHAINEFRASQKRWNESAEEHLWDLRVEVNLVGQKRREKLAKKKLEDQLSDALEATIAMRSLMLG